MTRWGLLSDIHGNRPALERALADFQARGVERIAVLGDNLGRGDSDGCVEVIRRVADVSVVGNRDLDWQDRVTPASRDYVLSLPRLSRVDDLVFTHGDARLTRDLSTAEIGPGFRRASSWMSTHGARVWFFGHSHRARVWRIDREDGELSLLFDAAIHPPPAAVRLPSDGASDAIWAINVGSVGLPFPGKGPASGAIYDASAGTLDFFTVSPQSAPPLPRTGEGGGG